MIFCRSSFVRLTFPRACKSCDKKVKLQPQDEDHCFLHTRLICITMLGVDQIVQGFEACLYDYNDGRRTILGWPC